MQKKYYKRIIAGILTFTVVLVGVFGFGVANRVILAFEDTANFFNTIGDFFSHIGKKEYLDEEVLVNRIKTTFPDVEFIKREEVEKETGDYSPDPFEYVYYFNNKGIEFTVTETKYFWWGEYLNYSNDYTKNMKNCFTVEKLCQESDKLLDKNIDVFGDSRELDFVYYANSYEDIPDAIQTFQEIYTIIYDYLPEVSETSKYVNIKFGIYGPTNDTARLHSYGVWFLDIYDKSEVDWTSAETNAFKKYKYNVNNGYITDPILTPDIPENTDSEDSDNKKEINTLYIDNEEFILKDYISEEQEVRFIDRYGSGSYSAILCFDTEEQLLTGILNKYYPKNKINIDKYEITYKIGFTKYTVTRIGASIHLKRGSRKINLITSGNLQENSTFYGEKYYVNLDDFVKLVNMSVEKIDRENGAIYLTTN